MSLEHQIIEDIEETSLEEITAESDTHTFHNQIKQQSAIIDHYSMQLKGIDTTVKQYVKHFKKAEKYARKKTKKEAKQLKKLKKEFKKKGLDANLTQEHVTNFETVYQMHKHSYLRERIAELEGIDLANTATQYVLTTVVMDTLEYNNDKERKLLEEYTHTTVHFHTQKRRSRFVKNPFRAYHEGMVKRFGGHATAAIYGAYAIVATMSIPGGGVLAVTGGIALGAAALGIGLETYEQHQDPRAEITKREFKQKKKNTLNTLVKYTLEAYK